MSERRRFSASERAALFLAADGRCAICNEELDPDNWHADHIVAYAEVPETDVIQGQATCPTCNLAKGSTGARRWQAEASAKYARVASPDFTLSATPGSGKTRWACQVARRLLDAGVIDRITVVVPTDALKTQWADAGGEERLDLRPMDNAAGGVPRDADGCVVTYAQVNSASAIHRRLSGRGRTLAIFDEIHHAGDDKSWGDSLRHAFEPALRRIALTGTPWRSDNNPIPFVHYDDKGWVVPDYAYEYGRAVGDRVCRPVVFHAYNGRAKWVEYAEVIEAHLAEHRAENTAAVLDAVLDPNSDWMPVLLAAAVAELDELRLDVPDAGGLVVAQTQWQAKAYAELLALLTGEDPVVVVSEDAEAKANLEAFKAGRQRWLVSVRMVSEGVDVPRLSVGVFANKTQTPLFFRQVVGRFVRQRKNDEHNAVLFMPALAELVRHAREIEDELRQHLEEQIADAEKREIERQGDQQVFELRRILGADGAILDRSIVSGDELMPEEIEQATHYSERFGIRRGDVPNLARLLREVTNSVPHAEMIITPAAPSKHRLVKDLKRELNRLVGSLAYSRAGEFVDVGAAKTAINTEIIHRWNVRSKMTIADLEEAIDWAAQESGRGSF